MADKTKVFISYSHDDADHARRVLRLAERLRSEGVDAWIDQYEPAPEQGWRQWMLERIRWADFVLMVCTETYRRRAEGLEKEGRGLGAVYETTLLLDELYDAGMRSERLVPVLFHGTSTDDIPAGSKQLSRYRLPRGYEDLYRRLTGQPKIVPRPLGTPRVLAADSITLEDDEPSSPVGSGNTAPPPAVQPPALTSSKNRPDYRDAHAERFGTELLKAYEQRDTLLDLGEETTGVDSRIFDLKKALRHGPQLQPGEVLGDGRYPLIRRLGHGGFATVWLARDREKNQRVAIKVLHGQFLPKGERGDRLFRGARQMAKLDHPHITRVRAEPKVEDGWAYFVMEYLPGGDFRRAVAAGGLDLDDRLYVAQKIAEALDHAHAEGVIHRDVKPANILLDEVGWPKLSDFDLVRAMDTPGMTRTHAGFGSYLYAAPECLMQASTATSASDIYSLAVTWIFAFLGQDPGPLFSIERTAFLRQLEIPNEVRSLLTRALDLDPKKRPESATELVRELREALLETETEVEAAYQPESGHSFNLPPPSPAISTTKTRKPSDLFSKVATKDGEVDLWSEIPAGKGWIGSLDSEAGRDEDEGPRHRIEVQRPFWMMAVPVTNVMYAAKDPNRADADKPAHPVVNVTWDEAMEFCRWLAEEQGFEGARLPTEEEWEYACRAGSETRYWNGDTEQDLAKVGWYATNSNSETHTVGEKPANPWGLHDVHGNAWEWTASRWKSDYSKQASGLTIDPTVQPEDLAEPSRARRVMRGGSYGIAADWARSAYRWDWRPESRWGVQGFRVLLSRPPSWRSILDL